MGNTKKHGTSRILCAILAALTLLPVAACGEAASTSAQTTAVGAGETTAEETTTELTPDLPDTKYDGYTFTVLISGNTENGREKNDFDAPEITGEPINDAIYQRNSDVAEKFGVTIANLEEYGAEAGGKKFANAVMAGDNSYDLGMLGGYACATLAKNALLYDLTKASYINLKNPWWDQKAYEGLAILGKMFYTTGDISTADNDATQAMLFSKSLVKSYSLADPYAMVKDGTWTMDNFTAMASSVSSDLNGDAVYDKNDRFGAIIWDDTMMGIYNASGDRCCSIGDDGLLQLTFYTDRAVSMFDKFSSFAFDTTKAYAYQRVSYTLEDPINMFSNDQALFFLQLLDLVTYFRDMKNDFGILPYPKYDEAQTEYYQTIGSWHSVFMCLPQSTADIDRTSAVVEFCAWDGYRLITPAYYTKTLVGKYTRDDESGEMLDLIFASRVYDLGWYYQVGGQKIASYGQGTLGFNEQIMNLFRKYKTDFASMYAKYEDKAKAAVDEINTAFEAMN